MKKGQTSIRDGIEDFLCPFTDMYITQGAEGNVSHTGTKANDVNAYNGNTIRFPYYAPCTVKCITTYPSNGQAMWQSVNKVRCSNRYVGIVTFMTAHDNTMNATPGLVVKQGDQLGNLGDKGDTTGVHCHIEISQSSDTWWAKNKYGIYCFRTETDTDDCYFCNDTNILNMKTADWKYLKDVPVTNSGTVLNSIPSDFKYERGTFSVTVNTPIKVRRAPSVNGEDTGYQYAKGNSVVYDGYVIREGYV